MKLRRNMTRIAKWIAFLLLLLLALLPAITSQLLTYAIKDFLHAQGFEQIVVRKLWVNPYSGRVALHALEYEDDSEFYYLSQLELDLSMLELLRKKLEINKFSLDAIKLSITEDEPGQLTLNGIVLPLINETEKEIGGDQPEQINAGDIWHYSINKLSINDFSFQSKASEIDAKITLNSFTVNDLSSEDSDEFPISARLSVENLKLNNQNIGSKFDVDINSKITFLIEPKRVVVHSKNVIELGDVDIELPELQLQKEKITILLNADLELAEVLSYQVESDVIINGLKLTATSAGEVVGDLLAIKRVELSGLKFNSDKSNEIDLSVIAIDDITLLKFTAQPALVDNADIVVSNLLVYLPDEDRPVAIDIANIEIDRAKIKFLIDDSGRFPQLSKIQNKNQGGEEEISKLSDENNHSVNNEQSNSPGLKIKEVVIGPEVVIDFEDHSVTPSFYESLKIENLRVADFELGSDKMASVTSVIELSHNAHLNIDGIFSAADPKVDIKATLKKYQLLQASGYAQRSTGYALESGTININSDIQIEDQKVNLDNTILIDQLNLRPENQDRTVQYAKKLTMPLDQALDLLRDGKNQIQLQIPVSGPLNDPDINIDNIINQALGGALKKASISLLKYMLQPYSTVITVARFANDQMSKIRLDPVTYGAGEVSMDDEIKGYAGKIAEILKSKKGIKLKVCGSTNGDDVSYLSALTKANSSSDTEKPSAKQMSKQLDDLAHRRSSEFRRYLIDELSVEEDKLLICLPMHGDEPNSVSGIELLL